MRKNKEIWQRIADSKAGECPISTVEVLFGLVKKTLYRVMKERISIDKVGKVL